MIVISPCHAMVHYKYKMQRIKMNRKKIKGATIITKRKKNGTNKWLKLQYSQHFHHLQET
jgi:hypothetical protein